MKLQKYILFIIASAIFTLIPNFLLPKAYAGSTGPGCNTLNPNPSSCVTAPNNNIIDYGTCTGAIGNDRATCCKGNVCSDKIISNPSSPEPSPVPYPSSDPYSPTPCPQASSGLFHFPVAHAEGVLIAPAVRRDPCGDHSQPSPTPISNGPGISDPCAGSSGVRSSSAGPIAPADPCPTPVSNGLNPCINSTGANASSGCKTGDSNPCAGSYGVRSSAAGPIPPTAPCPTPVSNGPEISPEIIPDLSPYIEPAPEDNQQQNQSPQDQPPVDNTCPYEDHPEYCDNGTPDNSQPAPDQGQTQQPTPEPVAPGDPYQGLQEQCGFNNELGYDPCYQEPAPVDLPVIQEPDPNTAPGECPYYDHPEYCDKIIGIKRLFSGGRQNCSYKCIHVHFFPNPSSCGPIVKI